MLSIRTQYYYSRFFPGLVCILLMQIFSACEDNITEKEPIVYETGTLTDFDGNIYRSVKIGDQWWMAEDLKVNHYRNGDPVSKITDSTGWTSVVTGAYCEYQNGTGGLQGPGNLYNGYAVNDSRGLAPQGWHIPTDDEWKRLEQYLGMSSADADRLAWRGSDQGDKLKSADQNEWISSGSTFPTNESGMTALAGSCRLFNGDWGYPGLKYTGFWWSLSGYSGTENWYRYLDHNSPGVFRSHVDLRYGMSIRCIKD